MKTKLCRPVLIEINEESNLFRKKGTNFLEYVSNNNYKGAYVGYELLLISLDPDDKIEVGDKFWYRNYKLMTCTGLSKSGQILTNNEIAKHDYYGQPQSLCKKVIVTQDQIPIEYIQQFIIEFNEGKVKDVEIEMEDRFGYCNKCGAYQYVSFLICNYHPNCGGKVIQKIGAKIKDGFIIIPNTELPLPQYPHNLLSNMQYYMEYCQAYGYVTPQEWLTEHKHYTDSQEPTVYTEEEVKSLCNKAYNYGFNGGLYEHSHMQSKEHDCNSFNEWFETNKKN